MEIDPNRWPEVIRNFVDRVASDAEGLIVSVNYIAPVWTVQLACPCCKLARVWKIVGSPPIALPEETPLADWIGQLNGPLREEPAI